MRHHVRVHIRVALACALAALSCQDASDPTLDPVTDNAAGTLSEEAAASASPDAAVTTATRVGHYVAPGGAAGGPGTAASPWSLAYALGQPAAVQPGDTIWLRAGSYRGDITSRLNGREGAPVVLRQYPGERATIDGRLRIEGTRAVYWGFELMSSVLNPPDDEGISVYGANNKLINLVVHDRGGNGLGVWEGAVDAEVYGTIIYNNGRQREKGGAAHGIYSQNATGTKRLVNNIIFNQFGYGLHIYAEGGQIQGFDVVGNVAFNNGAPGPERVRPNILVGGYPAAADRITLDRNMTYTSPSLVPAGSGKTVELGYGSQNGTLAMRDNYFTGGDPVLRLVKWRQATVSRNTFASPATLVGVYGSRTGFQWSSNTWYRDPKALAWGLEDRAYTWAGWRQASGLGSSDNIGGNRPSGVQVFVRPNRYEPGRATVVVYNWAGQASVGVNLSGVLRSGQRYTVRNVQTFFGTAVATGTYSGSTVTLPLSAVTPPRPVGGSQNTPPSTGPEFNVFVVLPAS